MIEMLVIAFLVCILDKTGFMITPDIEDIIYVKENGEESKLPQKDKVLDVEEPSEEKTSKKKQNKKVSSPVVGATAPVVEEMQASEVITEEMLELEVEDIAAFANEFLSDTYDGG